jgi:hypothetical protein
MLFGHFAHLLPFAHGCLQVIFIQASKKFSHPLAEPMLARNYA